MYEWKENGTIEKSREGAADVILGRLMLKESKGCRRD
jgi:hypothetical protein